MEVKYSTFSRFTQRCKLPATSICMALLVCFSCIGCATKAAIKSRTEILNKGNPNMPVGQVIENENEQFLQFEKDQKARLKVLLNTRALKGMSDSSYKIGSQDELQLSVFDVPELQGNFRVNPQGTVTLPLIGLVHVQGLTENEAAQAITQELSRFVKRPQVTLSVGNFSAQQVAVLGAVSKPGNVALRKGTNSLLEVISLAGGVKDHAGNYLTFVPFDENIDQSGYTMQQAEGKSPVIGIDIPLDQVLGTSGGLPLNLQVRGGDMIIIPESGKITVEGEVTKAGSFDLDTQMTVLSAIATAGGLTYAAKPDEIEIVRDLGYDKKLHLVLSLQAIGEGTQNDVRLRNGDIVRIPTDSGKRMTQDVFEGLSRIVNFGIGGTVNVAH